MGESGSRLRWILPSDVVRRRKGVTSTSRSCPIVLYKQRLCFVWPYSVSGGRECVRRYLLCDVSRSSRRLLAGAPGEQWVCVPFATGSPVAMVTGILRGISTSKHDISHVRHPSHRLVRIRRRDFEVASPRETNSGNVQLYTSTKSPNYKVKLL